MLNGIFITSIRNTVVYTIFTVNANISIGLALASLIQPLSNKMRTFFRAAYYLPAVTSALIIGLTWAYIYNAQWGFATYLTRALGLPPIRWLSDPDIALTPSPSLPFSRFPRRRWCCTARRWAAFRKNIMKRPSWMARIRFNAGGISPSRC